LYSTYEMKIYIKQIALVLSDSELFAANEEFVDGYYLRAFYYHEQP